MFNIDNWEQTGELIIESASRGDETAKNIMSTWRLVLDTLKMKKAERDAAMEAPHLPNARKGIDGETWHQARIKERGAKRRTWNC